MKGISSFKVVSVSKLLFKVVWTDKIVAHINTEKKRSKRAKILFYEMLASHFSCTNMMLEVKHQGNFGPFLGNKNLFKSEFIRIEDFIHYKKNKILQTLKKLLPYSEYGMKLFHSDQKVESDDSMHPLIVTYDEVCTAAKTGNVKDIKLKILEIIEYFCKIIETSTVKYRELVFWSGFTSKQRLYISKQVKSHNLSFRIYPKNNLPLIIVSHKRALQFLVFDIVQNGGQTSFYKIHAPGTYDYVNVASKGNKLLTDSKITKTDDKKAQENRSEILTRSKNREQMKEQQSASQAEQSKLTDFLETAKTGPSSLQSVHVPTVKSLVSMVEDMKVTKNFTDKLVLVTPCDGFTSTPQELLVNSAKMCGLFVDLSEYQQKSIVATLNNEIIGSIKDFVGVTIDTAKNVLSQHILRELCSRTFLLIDKYYEKYSCLKSLSDFNVVEPHYLNVSLSTSDDQSKRLTAKVEVTLDNSSNCKVTDDFKKNVSVALDEYSAIVNELAEKYEEDLVFCPGLSDAQKNYLYDLLLPRKNLKVILCGTDNIPLVISQKICIYERLLNTLRSGGETKRFKVHAPGAYDYSLLKCVSF